MKNNPFDRINNIPKIDLDYLKPIREQREHMNIVQKELEKVIAEADKEREQYKQEVLQTLKNIETNTVGLNQIVPLLAQNNENQQQIIELLKQALEIAASQNEEEAKSKWRSFMDKLHQTISDVETIQKLQGFANIILAIFQNIKG